MEHTGQGNNTELIPMVEMETRNPVMVVNFGRSVINHCRVMAA